MIDILFIIKPIIDMLWKYQIFDILLLGLLALYLLPRIFHAKLSIASIFLVIFSIVLFKSFLVKVDSLTASIFLKIISTVLIFFAAQFNKNIDKTLNYLSISYVIPVFFYLFFLITGKGYIYWGSVKTFVGPYYYKTDLAIAVILSVIFLRKVLFFSNNKLLLFLTRLYIFVLAPIFILLANSRAMTVIYGIFFIILFIESAQYKPRKQYNKRRKLGYKLKRNILIFTSIIIVAGGYIIYTKEFQSSNSLSISLNKDKIFSLENTQGRSGIWTTITENFYKSDFQNIMFGHYINKEYELNTYSHQDAHNTYLKILVTTGFFGLTFYILFNLFIFRRIRFLYKRSSDSESSRFIINSILMVTTFFILSGLTQSNIIYTQSSWYAFYFMGLLYNSTILREKESIEIEKSSKKDIA